MCKQVGDALDAVRVHQALGVRFVVRELDGVLCAFFEVAKGALDTLVRVAQHAHCRHAWVNVTCAEVPTVEQARVRPWRFALPTQEHVVRVGGAVARHAVRFGRFGWHPAIALGSTTSWYDDGAYGGRLHGLRLA